MNVKEALDRLSLPGFYTDMQRIAAYYIIMELGNSVQKVMADKLIGEYPLEEFFQTNAQAA